MNLFYLFIGAMLINNILLTNFLGLTSVLIVVKKKDVFYIELFITLMSLFTTILVYFSHHYLLGPNHLDYLMPLVAIIIMIILTTIIIEIIKRYFNSCKEKIREYLTLLFFSPVTLSIGLLAISKGYNFYQTVLYSLGSSIGLLIILYVYSHLKERMDNAPIIRSFKGIPIAFITISIMAMIFARYVGI